jgi:hypothetical protein
MGGLGNQATRSAADHLRKCGDVPTGPATLQFRLDDRGLLTVLPQDARLIRSKSLIFIAMHSWLAFIGTSEGRI